MFTTRSTYRPAVVCVLACALLVPAAPVAAAQPADMHTSVAQAAAKARQNQDLRSADTRDAAVSPRKQDLRHLQAGGSYTPGSTPAVSGQPGAPPSTRCRSGRSRARRRGP